MKAFFFDLQRFSILPTLLNGEDGGGVRYWNTVPGAEVAGFGGTFFVNHGANCVLQCGNVDSHVYNDTMAPGVRINGGTGNDYLINDGISVNIYGNGGNDRLYNHDLGKKTNIYGGVGNDYIDNRATDVHVYAGDNNDYVWNNGSKVSIDAGSGDDEIYNHGGSKVSMVGGDNDDKIYNWGTTCILEGGKGSDYLDNYASDTKIYGGENDDNINNQSSNVTIDGGANNDYIYNKGGSNVSLNGGDGDNTIQNGYFEGHIQLPELETDDIKFIIDESVKGGDFVTMISGENDDEIQNFGGKNITIDTGDGKNLVSLGGVGENISVQGGSGNDSIYGYVGKPLVRTEGQLQTVASGKYVTINTGGGNNLVTIGNTWSYLTINGGNSSLHSDVVKNEASNAFINGNAGNDYIYNSGDRASIFGGDHGDIIENYGNNVYINGDDSNSAGNSKIGDYIYTDKANDVTIDGGIGNDLIEAWHDVRASISGGAGNDRIHLYRVSTSDKQNILWKIAKVARAAILSKISSYNEITEFFSTGFGIAENLSSLYKADKIADILKGTAVTIGDIFLPVSSVLEIKKYVDELSKAQSTVAGGAGDDTIVADGYAPRVFEYSGKTSYGNDGNDVIYNFNSNKTGKDSNLSTLEIKSGRIKNIAVNGGDVKFTVEKGSIKLVDGANKKFKLIEDEESKSASTRAYGINSDTGEVVCSIFGSAKGDDLKDNVGIERDKTTYISPVGTESQYTVIGETFANVIYGYGGSDLLSGNDKNDTLFGGTGNDYLYGNAGDDYLDGGTGNDYLYGGDGKDTIKSYGDTVDAGKGNDSIENSGSKASIVAGADKDTIYSSGNSVTIDAGTGDDSIVSYGDKSSLVGGGNNDTIEAHGYNITIEGGKGNDSISAGSDSDTLSNNNLGIKIVAGADNDTVISKNANAKIYGGTGNDLVSLSSAAKKNYIEYKDGDGNDVIDGFNDDDTLKISSGKVSAATVNGSDVVLTVGNGSIRMKKFKNKTFKLTASDGEVFKYRLSLDKKENHLIGSIVGGKGQTTLYGTSGAEIYSGSKYGDLIYGNEGKDNLSGKGGNDTINGGAGDDVLYGDGGTNTLVGGSGNDMIYAFGKGDFISYTSGDGSDTVSGSGTIEILGASYSSVASEGNMILNVDTGSVKLINNARGNLFKVLGACTNQTLPEGVSMNGNTMKITVKFKDDEIDLRYYPKVKTVDASKAPKGLEITGNGSANSFKGSNYSDIIHVSPPSASNVASNKSVAFSNDALIVSANLADTAVDAVTISAGGGNDTIYGSDTKANIYSYAAGDGNDIVYNFGAADTLSITGGSYSKSKSGKNLVVTVGKGKITLKDAASLSKVNIIGTKVVSTLMTVTNSTSSPVTIDSVVKTVDASARTKAVKITGNSQNNLILGGKAADTLGGGAGNDTLTGGKGNDVFVYTAGKDVITDYAVGDKISIGADISKSTVSGTDAVFTIGSSTLTVKKAKGKKIAFVDAKGKLRTVIGGAQIFTDSSSAKVTLSSGVEVGDATTCTKAINLTGNALNNTILGSTKNDSLYGGKGNDSLVGSSGNDKLYGQAGADTLIGGAGNDSLWGGTGNDLLYGGDGKDVFIYKPGEGTDKIFDYSSGDMLTILKSNGNAGGTFKSSKYSGGDLTLTINGGGTVIFDGVNKGDKFNINGKTYTLGTSKLK